MKEEIIALNGEAVYQPDLLRGDVHFRTPLVYKIHVVPLVTIPQGKVAYVFSRDGKPLEPAHTLGKVVEECNNFQDVRGFLMNWGQKGPQRGIIREGTYAFNLAQLIIITETFTYCLKIDTRAEQEILIAMANLIHERKGFEPVIIQGNADLSCCWLYLFYK